MKDIYSSGIMPSRKVVSGLAVISQKFVLYLSELWNISYLSYKSRTSAKNSISEYADTQPRRLHCKVHHISFRRVCLSAQTQFALVTRRPYCPGGPKKLCFTTLSLNPMVSITRLSVALSRSRERTLGTRLQSSFGLPGQYGRHVTRVNIVSARHPGRKCTGH